MPDREFRLGDTRIADRRLRRLGMIVPASNTNAEPDCLMLAPQGMTSMPFEKSSWERKLQLTAVAFDLYNISYFKYVFYFDLIRLAGGFSKLSQTVHETGKNTSQFSVKNSAFLTGSPHFP